MPATTPRPPSSEQVVVFDRTAWSRSIGIPGRNPRNPQTTNQGTVNLHRPFSIEVDHIVGAISDQSQNRRCVLFQAIAVIDTK
jgi:hypothetical protein